MTDAQRMREQLEKAGVPYTLVNGEPIPHGAKLYEIQCRRYDASFDLGPWRPEIRKNKSNYPYEAWAVCEDGRAKKFAQTMAHVDAEVEARTAAYHLNPPLPDEVEAKIRQEVVGDSLCLGEENGD